MALSPEVACRTSHGQAFGPGLRGHQLSVQAGEDLSGRARPRSRDSATVLSPPSPSLRSAVSVAPSSVPTAFGASPSVLSSQCASVGLPFATHAAAVGVSTRMGLLGPERRRARCLAEKRAG